MSNDFLPVHLIQTFVAFIEAANITEAAEKLGISQPAVSVHLKKLEEMLPYPVFTMEGKRKVPSQYGKTLYHSLSPALRNLNQQLQLVNAEFSEEVREINVGYADAIQLNYFKGNAPGYQFSFHLALNEEKGFSDLKSKNIDFLLSNKKIADESFRRHRLQQSSWAIFSSQNWILQKNQKFDQAWITRTPMISVRGNSSIEKQFMEHYCLGRPTHPNKTVVGDSLAAMQLVQRNLGFAILSVSAQAEDSDLQQSVLPESIFSKENFYIYSLKNSADEAALDCFKKK